MDGYRETGELPVGDILRKITDPGIPYGLEEYFITTERSSGYYHFDAEGRHLETLDPITGTPLLNFSYNEKGHLANIIDKNEKEIKFEYHSDRVEIISPDGEVTTLTLNERGYLSSVSNPAGETHNFTYHEEKEGLLTSISDPKGNITTYDYDEKGRLRRSTDPINAKETDGFYKKLKRDEIENGFKVTVTTAGGTKKIHEVLELPNGDKIRKTTFPDGTHNEQTTYKNGNSYLKTPDSTIYTEKTGDPRFKWMKPYASKVTTTTGSITTVSEVTKEAELGDETDPFSYSEMTDTITVNGLTTSTTYRKSDRSYTTTSPMGKKSITYTDEKGRTERTVTPGLEEAKYIYYPDGKIKTITMGDRTSEFTYNSDGYLETKTDSLGRVSYYEYDLAGRVTRKIFEPGTEFEKEVSMTYDENGNVETITPPGRTAHSYHYNDVDLSDWYEAPLISGENPRSQYTYGKGRELLKVEHPNGATIENLYNPTSDKLDKITLTKDGSVKEVNYIYYPDNGKKIHTVTTSAGESVSYTYDGALTKTEELTGTVNATLAYDYDNFRRITKYRINDTAINYTYDDDGQALSIGDIQIPASGGRDSSNGLLKKTVLDNITTERDYTTYGELNFYEAKHDTESLYKFDIGDNGRDPLSRITQLTETIADIDTTYNYIYDRYGRLEKVLENGTELATYTYDTNGNRRSYFGPMGNIMESETEYDEQDRLKRYGDITYEYDFNGNLELKTELAKTTSYSYDAGNSLTKVEIEDGVETKTVEYIYDAQGLRIARKLNNTITNRWLYKDGLNPVAELDSDGNITTLFVYANRLNVPSYLIKGNVKYRVIADHLGSVRMVVNSSTGEVVQQIDYDEFGNVLLDTNPGFQPFYFAGGIHDPDTKLIQFGARDYDSFIGRWIEKDPIKFDGGSNFYVYSGNDPVNFIDPNGEIAIAALIAIGYGIFEVGMTIYDVIDTILTLVDPCESNMMKGISVGGIFLGIALPGGGYGKAGKETAEQVVKHSDDIVKAAKRFTPDQSALIDLAKQAKKTGGVDADEAKILQKWAKEYDIPHHPKKGFEIHPERNYSDPHIHIGPVDHISKL